MSKSTKKQRLPDQEYMGWIGQKVVKHSGKPFKSGKKTATVKGYASNPNSGKVAFVFEEDDSVVDAYQTRRGLSFDELPEFTKHYVIAALWSSNDESDPSGGDPIDSNYDGHDVDPATLETMHNECKAFQEANAADLALAYELYQPCGDGSTPEQQAGHDFWLTRCGHGCGFWDRGLGEVGDRLTEASQKCGERHLWVENGVVYQE
jgi:hypothetical protein